MTFSPRHPPRTVLNGDVACNVLKARWDTRLYGRAMRDPLEVLRRKEAELQSLQEEVEALRMVGQLLSDQKMGGIKPENRSKILQMTVNLSQNTKQRQITRI